jgi:TfoX/Sxy family transcriptional regulator of competence genes
MFDEDLAARVRHLLTTRADVTEKRMFGGLAFIVAGHMAVAASGHGGLMVRVPPEQTAALLAEPGTRPMEMRGTQTKGWIRVDGEAAQDDDELARWVAIGVEQASTSD